MDICVEVVTDVYNILMKVTNAALNNHAVFPPDSQYIAANRLNKSTGHRILKF